MEVESDSLVEGREVTTLTLSMVSINDLINDNAAGFGAHRTTTFIINDEDGVFLCGF